VWSDHLNTPRLVTDAANNDRWEWPHNDPFGNNPANENPQNLGAFSFNLRFPGQYYDVETGTHYNYFRDYDPVTGRYVQSDPIGLIAGQNTYGYVRGRPMKRSDPYGLIDIYIGGLADASMGTVRDWVRDHAPSAKYFEWDQRRDILQFISGLPQNEPINLIGHSYGGDTAAWVAVDSCRTITSLVTIDPVSRIKPSYDDLWSKVFNWTDVSATPTRPDYTDSIAVWGGQWGRGPFGFADRFVSVDANHGDFGALMNAIREGR
jgi:RHS repeat-associated protein